MSDKNPKVSVIMPVYNQEKFLKESIDSILNQTFKDFELIIINDGSTDQTSKILKQYVRKDLRIKIFFQKNQGCTKSLNYGIRQARGKYIARQDADDISLSKRLEKQVEFLERNKNIGLLGCFAQVIDEQGNKKQKILGQYTIDKDLKRYSFWSNRFCHSTIMIIKELLHKINGYDDYFVYSQDTDLYFRLMPYTQFANLKEVFLLYREHEDSVSKIKKKEQERFAQEARKRAIKSGFYPKYYLLFLLFIPVLPIWLKKVLKKIFKFLIK